MIPFVSVIIVNYNAGSYVLTCVSSLLQQREVRLELIVIDNASSDNSLELLKSGLPETVQLILSEVNLGFGRANNLAIASSHGDYLLVLNPDTQIEDVYVIKKLVDRLNSNQRVGLLAPAVVEPRKNKVVLPRFDYPSSKYLRKTLKLKSLPGKIAWVLGACMLLKREIFQQIGGFDKDFFLYGEDVDLCLRVRLAGYEIDYASDVSILHVSGASEIGASSLDKWLRKRRGIFMFYKKHYAIEDQRAIAKRVLFRSTCYLLVLQIKMNLFNLNSPADIDKKARLQASIIVAREILSHI